jgi:hypothetical protein
MPFCVIFFHVRPAPRAVKAIAVTAYLPALLLFFGGGGGGGDELTLLVEAIESQSCVG